MPIENKKNNLFLKLLSRYIYLVAILLAVVLLVVGYIFILQPKISLNKNNPELSLEFQEKVLTERKEKLQQLNNLIDDYKKLPNSHFAKINELLPLSNEAPILFTHLSGLAKANDTVLLNVATNELGNNELITLFVNEGLVAPKDLKVIEITADFLGKVGNDSYPFFKQLVRAIEKNIRLFDIQYITFSPTLANFTFTARTYYLQTNE
jgi:hypothetical protein